MALTKEDVQFIEGEGVNVYVCRGMADQEGEGQVKGLPYGSNKKTCPVTALGQWLQAAEKEIQGSFEGGIFRRFYRGEPRPPDSTRPSIRPTPCGRALSRRRSGRGSPSGA